MSACVLWTGWPYARVVPVLLVRVVPVRLTWHTQVPPNVADMWRPTEVSVGPNTVDSPYC